MPARATTARRYPKPLELPAAGPFVGMLDAEDPSVARPDLARMLRNCYVPTGITGAPVEGRPGHTLAGAPDAPLGGLGARTGQFLGQFTRLNGTTYTIAICGGKFYTYDWAGDAWTETLEASDFSGASVTLSTTARVFMSVLGNEAVFTDGINTAWKWDGTAGGGVTELTGAPIFFGPPTVYYSRLAAPKAAARGTFVWSEVRDPALGYDIGGYNLAWDFDVTGTDPLTYLAATNEALYVGRARQIARVVGRMEDDFETAGTRTDVAEDVGFGAPPLATQRGVFFVDADSRPHLITPAGGVVKLWPLCSQTLLAVNKAAVANAVIVQHPELDAVMVGLATGASTSPTTWLLFRVIGDASARMVGVFDSMPSDTAGLVMDQNGRPRFMRFGIGDGFVYTMGLTTGSTWNDTTVVSAAEVPTAIAHEVAAHPIAPDPDRECHFDRVTWVVKGYAATTYSVRYRTSRGLSMPQAVAGTGGVGSVLGLGRLGTFVLGASAPENRLTVGVTGHGRYIAPRVSHAELGKRFGAVMATAQGFAANTDPGIP